MFLKKILNNKKNKLIFISLLLVFVVSLFGYGVYSYYYTEDRSNGTGYIYGFKSFNPEIIIDDNSDFLGYGGSATLDCPDGSDNGNEIITCTASINVTNNGETTIYLDTSDVSISTDNSKGLSFTSVSNSLTFEDSTLSPGETTTLNISANIQIVSDLGSAEPVFAEYSKGGCDSCYNLYLTLDMDFNIIASTKSN